MTITAISATGQHGAAVVAELPSQGADVIGFGALRAHPLSDDSTWGAVLHRQKQIYLAGLSRRGPVLKELPK